MRLTRIAIAVMVTAGLAGSQTSPPASFEVVSIKPHKSGDGFVVIKPSPGGRLITTNTSLKMLIAWSYQLRDGQISKAPGWADSEGYDVAAKAEGNPRFDFLQPTLETMFQAVLAERFKLTLHHETKQLPVYKLTVAKRGSTLNQAAQTDLSDCLEKRNPDLFCGQIRLGKPGELTGQKANMRGFALLLSALLDKTVIDQTGLTGSYDFKLNWSEQMPIIVLPPNYPAPPPPDRATIFANRASAVSAALEEQLGLELQPAKGPVDILVIDHVERPSEN